MRSSILWHGGGVWGYKRVSIDGYKGLSKIRKKLNGIQKNKKLTEIKRKNRNKST